MLDEAIELLSSAQLHKLAKKFFELKRLRPDAEQATTSGLLKAVKRFEKASLAGEYYESFNVNSAWHILEKCRVTPPWTARACDCGSGRSFRDCCLEWENDLAD